MENWTEHFLLTPANFVPTQAKVRKGAAALMLSLAACGPHTVLAQETDDTADKPAPVQVIAPEVKPRTVRESDIDSEFFEVGAFAGVLSIDNFSSEPVFGVSAAFHATEDFFIQANFGMSEAGLTSFEELSGSNVRLLTDSDRDYTFYNFLVGYNIFPGEVFFTDKLTFNSAFYLVGGVGNTEFGGERNFTTTLGTGYRIVLLDWLTVHMDFRDHMFKSDLIRESQLTHNIELSSGVTLFF
ncbi:outer membrane beta-barrel domain-containing protein [Marinobacter sp. SS21]|uniref:outer membrane beta-barrel domain-containing protein n=1 Tax=Marinobacter sp. SS21 TaxID=2979460 RepID=UPI00232FA6C8|nr:outer membrane beta-barrel domain-containing protein [Marinobacter sp. SS21]MDC0662414.1 outer membrane beta-barrel domain-containing protein [Marinobacter sp. SS21]